MQLDFDVIIDNSLGWNSFLGIIYPENEGQIIMSRILEENHALKGMNEFASIQSTSASAKPRLFKARWRIVLLIPITRIIITFL